ncbi:fused MFS/spermidine synthase [bacterium]|nr:fused MFS/spermidine synthase [bacterium]
MNFATFFAFLLGAATLAFEVYGPRLIQSHFGFSPVLWASVISVFLGGLTVGYFLGGRIAEDSMRRTKIFFLWMGAGLFVFFSPVIASSVAELFLSRPGAPPLWEPLAGAFLIFFLPTVAMGTALPVLVAITPTGGKGAGRHTGRLLGISTLGSILGVLGLTFGLMGRLSLPQIALVLALPWVAGAFWMLRRKTRPINAISTLLFLALLGSLPHAEKTLWEGDSLLHHIRVAEDKTHRALFFNNWMESVMLIDDPLKGHFHYIEAFHLAAHAVEKKGRVCLVGLGGASAARTFLARYPQMEMVAAEIDPKVEELAQKWFGIPSERMEVRIQDGRQMFKREGAPTCKVVLLDAYSASRYGAWIPWHLTTKEFFTEVRGQMPEGGVVAYNVIGQVDGASSWPVQAIAKTMGTVFPSVWALPIPESRNVVLFGFTTPQDEDTDWSTLVGWGGAPELLRQLTSRMTLEIPQSKGIPILVDDFAPIDLPGLMIGP